MRALLVAGVAVVAVTASAFAAALAPNEIQTTFFTGQPFTASATNVKFKMTFTSDGKMTREPIGGGAKGEGMWKLTKDGERIRHFPTQAAAVEEGRQAARASQPQSQRTYHSAVTASPPSGDTTARGWSMVGGTLAMSASGGSTLRVFLAKNGHIDASSTELGIHRHTLRYRLGRVTELLDCSLDDPTTRAELWLALRMRELR